MDSAPPLALAQQRYQQVTQGRGDEQSRFTENHVADRPNAVYQNGAFLYLIEAMNPYAAGRKAGEILDRLLARSSFLRRKRSGLNRQEGYGWQASASRCHWNRQHAA
jgi:hypothetical protein